MKILRKYVREILNEKIRAGHGSTKLNQKFDINLFKTFTNVNDCYYYASSRLQLIGYGSSRSSFTLTSKKVLKIARTTYDVDQNKKEISTFKQYGDFDQYLTKIYDHDKNGLWIIADLVNPLNSLKELTNYFGIIYFNGLIRKICSISTSAFPGRGYDHSSFDDETFQKLSDEFTNGSEVSRKFLEFLINSYQKGLDVSDIGSYVQWGKTADGRIVLLDYGM